MLGTGVRDRHCRLAGTCRETRIVPQLNKGSYSAGISLGIYYGRATLPSNWSRLMQRKIVVFNGRCRHPIVTMRSSPNIVSPTIPFRIRRSASLSIPHLTSMGTRRAHIASYGTSRQVPPFNAGRPLSTFRGQVV